MYENEGDMFLTLFFFACSDKEPIQEEQAPAPGDGESGRMVGITDAHNIIRAEKGVDDLWWSEELAEISMDWLVHLSESGCMMEHNWDSPYGENLFWSTYDATGEEVVNSWASEEAFYDYESNSCQEGEQCGHYTQVVWSSTTKVGCAVLDCSDGSELWMCNYDPAGNWVGEQPY